MNRIAVRLTALFAVGLLLAFMGSCGDSEQTLGPNEHQQPPSRPALAVAGEGLVFPEEQTIFVAFPEASDVRGVCNSWISDAVLSILPDANRGRFFAKGIVYVDDAETAAAITIAAGLEDSYVSGGVWVGTTGTWGCIKCCYDISPCCTPCPDCCAKDKGRYWPVMM